MDAILKADPSGHRAFIEEAAGILKHRKRKERALRKLANTETNLSRLDDLLGRFTANSAPSDARHVSPGAPTRFRYPYATPKPACTPKTLNAR